MSHIAPAWWRSLSALTYIMSHNLFITFFFCETVIYQPSTSLQTLDRIKASFLDFIAFRRRHLSYFHYCLSTPLSCLHDSDVTKAKWYLPDRPLPIRWLLTVPQILYTKVLRVRLHSPTIGHLYPYSCLLSFFFPLLEVLKLKNH